MTARTVLLQMIRDMFPSWDISICDQGVWRAIGPVVITTSTVERLLDGLGTADPDALRAAAERFAGRTP